MVDSTYIRFVFIVQILFLTFQVALVESLFCNFISYYVHVFIFVLCKNSFTIQFSKDV